ncbi:MAG TPA: RagB/SusD family nutrient uptake outer membrane protein [Chitinophagaceae bacterium]|nr:RagB/SusD family nutrient uptake outer membrane protein [Chitinophagaceae bacterium]
MKYAIHKTGFLFLGACLLFAMGCKKSFIDLSDPTRIVTSDYYKDSASISTAVIATYASLQDMYGKSGGNRGLFPIIEVTSDNSSSVVEGSGIGEFEYFTFTSSNPVIQSTWTYCYRTIARCNIVLSRIEPVSIAPAVKERWKSEVKFIRALAYFNLVRIYGDVPLVTKEVATVAEAYQYGRSPAASIYTQIEQDLAEADADVNLPAKYTTATDIGRVTKAAVKGLLGKVYLTQKKYTDAVNKLNQFITQYDVTTHNLLANYSDIFLTTNEVNAEVIFSVRYTKGNVPSTGSPFTNYFAVSTANAGGVGTGYQYNSFRQDFIDTLNAQPVADKRILASYTTVNPTTWTTKKYTDVPAQDLDADPDWIVLRYADVLLMYAEALNEQNAGNVATAVPFVNRVRTRAGLSGAALLSTGITQAQLRQAIEKERRIELNMEGHRWFDLVRTDRALAVMNNHFTKYSIRLNASSPVVQVQSYQLLFPVPISEINTNPVLTQNPGY